MSIHHSSIIKKVMTIALAADFAARVFFWWRLTSEPIPNLLFHFGVVAINPVFISCDNIFPPRVTPSLQWKRATVYTFQRDCFSGLGEQARNPAHAHARHLLMVLQWGTGYGCFLQICLNNLARSRTVGQGSARIIATLVFIFTSLSSVTGGPFPPCSSQHSRPSKNVRCQRKQVL